ncbi:glycosyltransferase family 39 protein [Patescibacteria group bacterium]|nr:glycosyltransferase family 39 protein [Patescibacteria group bacterium]
MLNKEKIIHYLPLIFIISFAYCFYFWQLGSLPITAYDESIYAQVTRDTLNSGQIMTLKHMGNNWFEKPPLYFWLSMPMVKIFGDTEIAYRIISALSAIFSVLLIFLIIKKLSQQKYLALLSSFILAIIPFFYISSRQVRLDTPLNAIMLASVYFLIVGWKKEKYLLTILPLLALGFLMKSVSILAVIPIFFIFSFFYKKWSWLKSKWLWIGLPLSLLIVLPWHINQHLVWGSEFWQKYIIWNVWERAQGGFGIKEKVEYFAYLNKLWNFSQPWWQIFLLSIIIFLIINKFYKDKKTKQFFMVSLCSVLFIILFYSLSKTKISTYLIPAYPYIATVIGLAFYRLWKISKNKLIKILYVIIFTILVIYSISLSIGHNDKILRTLHYQFDQNLKEIGLIIREDNKPELPLYFLSGPVPDVISYYSGHQIYWLYPEEDKNQYNIPGPSYIMLTDYVFSKLFTTNGLDIKPQYHNMHLRYIKDHLMLLYTDSDVTIDL